MLVWEDEVKPTSMKPSNGSAPELSELVAADLSKVAAMLSPSCRRVTPQARKSNASARAVSWSEAPRHWWRL